LLDEAKLGPVPATKLTTDEHAKNNLPDILARWRERAGSETKRKRTEQSFSVTKADLKAQDYDLSINRYKEVVHAVVEHRTPQTILKELATLEGEIQKEMKALEGMLG
jgi:type I restriction enzyme M protein